MNFRENNRHIVDLLFVLALMLLFAFSAVTMIALGASIYRKNIAQMGDTYARRTSYAYIAEKLRQSDADGGVAIGTLDGLPALLLFRDVRGVSYTTWIYCYDGNLTELFAKSDAALPARAGQAILPLDAFSVRALNDTLYELEITEPGAAPYTMYLAIRSASASASAAASGALPSPDERFAVTVMASALSDERSAVSSAALLFSDERLAASAAGRPHNIRKGDAA